MPDEVWPLVARMATVVLCVALAITGLAEPSEATAIACADVVQAAHRGLGPDENTLRAFQAAVAAGMPAIETDLRLTRDGRFVLMHDPSVRRTTDGRGRVASMPWSRLRRLSTRHGEHPPALGEMLSALGSGSTRTEIQLELKVRLGSRALARLARELTSYGPEHVVVTSPHVSQLSAAKHAAPGIRTGLISFRVKGRPDARRAAAHHVDYLMVSRAAATPAYVDLARARGLEVSARYTDLSRAARTGISRVLTDRLLSCP